HRFSRSRVDFGDDAGEGSRHVDLRLTRPLDDDGRQAERLNVIAQGHGERLVVDVFEARLTQVEDFARRVIVPFVVVVRVIVPRMIVGYTVLPAGGCGLPCTVPAVA